MWYHSSYFFWFKQGKYHLAFTGATQSWPETKQKNRIVWENQLHAAMYIMILYFVIIELHCCSCLGIIQNKCLQYTGPIACFNGWKIFGSCFFMLTVGFYLNLISEKPCLTACFGLYGVFLDTHMHTDNACLMKL